MTKLQFVKKAQAAQAWLTLRTIKLGTRDAATLIRLDHVMFELEAIWDKKASCGRPDHTDEGLARARSIADGEEE